MIQKLASGLANLGPVKNHIIKSGSDPKLLARTLLITSVSKDVFAYALRVKNTLNNDEIPEDKKNFTAKMDAATCVATAVTQIGAGFIVSSEKFQSFFTDKLFKSLKNSAKAAFNAVSTLVLASIGAKRILTPLIATKIASFHENDDKQKPTNTNA